MGDGAGTREQWTGISAKICWKIRRHQWVGLLNIDIKHFSIYFSSFLQGITIAILGKLIQLQKDF